MLAVGVLSLAGSWIVYRWANGPRSGGACIGCPITMLLSLPILMLLVLSGVLAIAAAAVAAWARRRSRIR